MLEKNLNERNICALRDLARRTGVKSPTSKKKEELISEIVEIISGNKKPEVLAVKQGRPPKTFGYNLANVFNVNLNEKFDLVKQTFNQPKVAYESTDMITVAGWLELVNNNSALLWVEKDFKIESYFVPNEVLNLINVKMGDRVVAEVSVDENIKVVKKIFSVNSCPILQLPEERNCYENVSHNLPSRMIKFKNSEYESLNLMIGENAYFYGSNNNTNTTTIINLLNATDIQNKLYVNVSLADKNKIFVSALDSAEKFVVGITEDVDVSRRMIFLATERAKRILEEGEDVLIVVDDIMSIIGVDREDLNLVKNLVSITKEGKNKGSITLFAIMPNVGNSQIEKLADKRFRIVDNKILICE